MRQKHILEHLQSSQKKQKVARNYLKKLFIMHIYQRNRYQIPLRFNLTPIRIERSTK